MTPGPFHGRKEVMHHVVWQTRTIESGSSLRWVSPTFTLLLRKEAGELLVGKWTTGESAVRGFTEDEGDVPGTAEWFRFVVGREEIFELSPRLPDRAVVLKPETGRQLPSGRRGEYSFRVPVWAELSAGRGEKRTALMELPCRELSSTWFGDMATGELCYAHAAHLYTAGEKVEESETGQFEAEIKLFLRNASQSMLDFSSICVHVEHLSLYGDGDRIYTNEVFVIFSGTDQVSQVRFGKRGPRSAIKADSAMTSIAPPRIEPEKSILKRSFSFLKSLTEI